ncbi:MAG: sugar nucleotide-binding protein, partial [Spirochaetia bacterium]
MIIDEYGSPTSVFDLAGAAYDILEHSVGGTFHMVNEGAVSRLDVAVRVLDAMRPGRPTRATSRAAFERLSEPPRWGV